MHDEISTGPQVSPGAYKLLTGLRAGQPRASRRPSRRLDDSRS